MKKIITGLLTVIMLSTPCASVFAFSWGGHGRSHRRWRRGPHRRGHHLGQEFALPFIALSIAAQSKPRDQRYTWQKIVNNSEGVKSLEREILQIRRVINDRDREVDNLKNIIDEMKNRIRELEGKIK